MLLKTKQASRQVIDLSLIINRIITLTVVTHIGFCFIVKSSTQHVSPTFTTDTLYPFFSLPTVLKWFATYKTRHSSSSSVDSSLDSTAVFFVPRFDLGLSCVVVGVQTLREAIQRVLCVVVGVRTLCEGIQRVLSCVV